MTNEGRRFPGRARAVRIAGAGGGTRALAALLCALLIAACDGGIFGTGDGSVTVPPVDGGPLDGSGDGPTTAGDGGTDGETATGDGDDDADEPGIDDTGGDTAGDAVGVTTSGDSVDGTTGGTTGGDSDDDTGGDTGEGTMPPDATTEADVPSSAFENTLVAGAAPMPRVRLINASGERMTLVDADGAPLLPDALPPAGSSDYADVALDTESLTVRRVTATGATAVYRLEPLTLGASSVTTFVVRDTGGTGDGRGFDVVPLRTLTSPDDAAQTLVRVVMGARLTEPVDDPTDDPDSDSDGDTGGDTGGDAATAETFVLEPAAGESPGGTEVSFEDVAFDDTPATPYGSAPAGDYRLSGSEGSVSSLPLSLSPDTVYTLVVVGTDRVMSVVDGAPGAR